MQAPIKAVWSSSYQDVSFAALLADQLQRQVLDTGAYAEHLLRCWTRADLVGPWLSESYATLQKYHVQNVQKYRVQKYHVVSSCAVPSSHPHT